MVNREERKTLPLEAALLGLFTNKAKSLNQTLEHTSPHRLERMPNESIKPGSQYEQETSSQER